MDTQNIIVYFVLAAVAVYIGLKLIKTVGLFSQKNHGKKGCNDQDCSHCG